MVMAGYEFMGECPFTDVYFNSIIRDLQGRKMSKSLGNSPDPLDVIANYGADALALHHRVAGAAGRGRALRGREDRPRPPLRQQDLERGALRADESRRRHRAVARRCRAALPGAALALPERWILSRLQAVDRRRARAPSRRTASTTRRSRSTSSSGTSTATGTSSSARSRSTATTRRRQAARARGAGARARAGAAPAAPVHAVRHRGDLAGAADRQADRQHHDRTVPDGRRRRAAMPTAEQAIDAADRRGARRAQHSLRARHSAERDGRRSTSPPTGAANRSRPSSRT